MTLTEIYYKEELKKYEDTIKWQKEVIEMYKDNPYFFKPADYRDVIGIYHKQENLSPFEWAECQIKYCERNIKIIKKRLEKILDNNLKK